MGQTWEIDRKAYFAGIAPAVAISLVKEHPPNRPMNEAPNQPPVGDRPVSDPAAESEPNSDAAAPEIKKLSPGSQFLTIFPPIMLPMFLAVADQTIVATALPAIASSLGEIERASWVVVSYLIANTIAAPVYGRLGDTFGRRWMMFVALGIFMVGSVLCALAPNIELLTAFRVLQGFGGGGLMTLSQALIGEAIPPRERGRYQGYLAGIAVTSNSFGPVAGGYLTQAFGWQSIFLINIPLGLIALMFVFADSGTPGRPSPHHFRFARPGPVHFLRRSRHSRARTSAAHGVEHAAVGHSALLGCRVDFARPARSGKSG